MNRNGPNIKNDRYLLSLKKGRIPDIWTNIPSDIVFLAFYIQYTLNTELNTWCRISGIALIIS